VVCLILLLGINDKLNGDDMEIIGKALAGHALRVSGHKKAEKYNNPMTDMVNNIISNVRNEGLSVEKHRIEVVKLAYRYLNIHDCPNCHYPKVKDFECGNCKSKKATLSK